MFFDTKNVERMDRMFYGCSRLTSISLENFYTQKVKSMKQMFYNCKNLKYLDIRHLSASFTPNILNEYASFGPITINKSFYNKIESQIGWTWSKNYID